MFKKLIFLASFFCIAAIAFGQNTGIVKGIVADSIGKKFDFIAVVVEEDQRIQTNTDANGAFQLTVPANQKLTLVFSSVGIEPVRRKIEVAPGATLNITQVVTEKIRTKKGITVTADRKDDNVGTVEVKDQKLLVSVGGSFEDQLQFQGIGVSKTNELSSAYSVRGGNFDENLVYVNDFEVYRPYLIRSGQQEGLTFINGSLVGNAKFTSGGFQARYGDKMSSVLDVTYKRPKYFGGSAYASLLGFGAHLEGADKSQRFTFLLGVRQRLSQYILKSLETKGEYSPSFVDVQLFATYTSKNNKWGLELISNYARNQFVFKPVNRETTFGLLTDVKKLTIYFDGQESDKYQTLMNGLSLSYSPNENLRFKLLGSHYLNREKEAYDILGEYFLSQVESDLGKDNFGEVLYNLGVGGLHDWGRNTLNTDVYYGGTRGNWFKELGNARSELSWGLDYKREVIEDKISQWKRLDSAGHSLPYNFTTDFNNPVYRDTNVYFLSVKDGIGMDGAPLRTQFDLKSNRISGFVQNSWRFGDSTTSRVTFNYGVRFSYWDVNKEFIITPRAQLTYKPKGKKDILLTAAVGTYYQPPFYREMRDLDGNVNTNLRSQKSLHAIIGINYAFKAWKRNFSFISEVYYKYLWDLVPYKYDNILIRYMGDNLSKGYAAGLDLRLNGELAEGAESWISMSIMQTQEDLKNDRYTAYFDSSGRAWSNIGANAERIVDSAVVVPGYIPRPTNQLVNFAMFFQDYIPKFKFIKVHLSMVFGVGLPFGPPGRDKYKDVQKLPPYRRVDIGFSGQLWNPMWAKQKNRFNQGLKGVWLSLEVFNIFGITNTVSYLWVRDISNTQYAVPNYLSSRRINAKIIVNF
ncbi:MAG TPA: carboxypeptidase-like regulatory domain-containing protein [Chitinophagales bacterium]|nr:carboxypeptidase-like regulatory domain-containing protein [Chitinophagales bacterium]